MIEGIGIDSVEVDRIARLIGKGEAYRDAVFTKQESEYCTSRYNAAASYAARFAAKEAFVKALGTGFSGNLNFRQIEVCVDKNGKPYLELNGEAAALIRERKIGVVQLSLTHTHTIATAIVILEK